MNDYTRMTNAIKWHDDIKEKSSFLQYICSDITDDFEQYIKDNKLYYSMITDAREMFNGT
jgi:hypothetical protein